MKKELRKEIELAEGITAQLNKGVLTIKGPKGEVQKSFLHTRVNISVEAKNIVVFVPLGTKKDKTILSSFVAHIKNMVKGVKEVYVYKLKVCSGHFPITATVSGEDFIVKNFLGESVSRKTKIIKGAEVKVNGAEVTVSSPSKEVAGQTAARIENLCRITNRDLRIFQDGIYMTQKAGKDI